MENVTFENEPNKYQTNRSVGNKTIGPILKLVMRSGLSDDEKGAERILVIIGLICVFIAIVIYFIDFKPRSSKGLVSPKTIERNMQLIK
jgi:hypothetical protein